MSPIIMNIKAKEETDRRAAQAAAKTSDKVYLATDPDREGEAISWHLARSVLDVPEDET